jgi:hypothetical protein
MEKGSQTLDETYRLEGLNLGSLLEVVQPILHVIYCHAAVDAIEAAVGNLWHTFVGPVPCLEITGRM